MTRYSNFLAALTLIILILFSACKKESFISSANASLQVSQDSIKFDTVFTSTGSITKSFKIFNDNNQKLNLSSVKLMGGPSSAFKININGNATTEENNIEIAANDSIYVFVSVFVNPSAANLPFILSDSIRISYNGNQRFVQLQAFGQNAHFFRDRLITGHETWVNDLPYVILGGLRVDTTATLSIDAGTKIYFHANAPLLVDGTLEVNGTKGYEVQFSGDRLDEYYRDLPASWPGIYFRNNSVDNIISYGIIKNANQAVVLQNPSMNTNPKLHLQQCIIDNAFDVGLLSSNSSVRADNTLISNCSSNIYIELGGKYEFTNCSVAAYSNTFLLHVNPVLYFSNASLQAGSVAHADLQASFINCIFWGDRGNVDNEVVGEKDGTTVFDVTLENCLYKAIAAPANVTLTNNILNEDPLFDSIDVSHQYYDFRTTINPAAPGVDRGIIVALPKDLDDHPRTVGQTDIGAYEKQ